MSNGQYKYVVFLVSGVVSELFSVFANIISVKRPCELGVLLCVAGIVFFVVAISKAKDE